jgi:hypothetical protein
MRKFLLACALAALPLAANATLQLSGSVVGGGTFNFTATDNNVGSHTLTDTDPTLNILQLGTTTIDGVVFNGSFTTALLAGPFELNSSSISIANTNPFPVTLTGVASATNFIGPANSVSVSGSGTFQNAPGGTMSNSWWDDPANAQGAPGTPGGLVFNSAPFTAAGSPSSYGGAGFSFTGPVNDPSAFSQTFSFTATLPAGSGACLTGSVVACPTIVGRQQASEKIGVPEPPALGILGMALLSLGLITRRRSA